MNINSNLGFFEKSALLIQNQIRSLNSPIILKNESIWISKITNLLNEIYMNLNEKILDDEIISKEIIAEYFFQELELKSKIQIEMKNVLRRSLKEIEVILIERIIQSIEENIISLWMEQ